MSKEDAEKKELPLILNGTFFLPDGKCKLCLNKTIKFDEKSTGNLHKHLKRVHPNSYSSYEALKAKNSKIEVKISGEAKDRKSCFSTLNSVQVNNEICDYIVTEMLPLCHVEQASFRSLLSTISGRSINIPCRKTIKTILEKRRAEYEQNLTNIFKEVAFICTTADIWSANNKSYFGVTGHYIDSTLARRSLVLACKRVRFSHTHELIGKTLADVHSQYGLKDSQISGTVTDNASNFCKAFKVYSFDKFAGSNAIKPEFLEESEIDAVEIDICKDDEIILPKQMRLSHA
ncbi:uncharacterized protein LOC128263868 [Drosophila gunungcola]|uniref:uncharacterized protein LOC128263868 n=1 Tax=Drosophila gunungcola TaxID=103775 RepID=UPI0022E16F4A|nr:uncharacterized protein LOC128263868 [Drosophila gunungcola]XP_052855101.1 uncharacterized protein LOC128263868 [Drosophila gunungcola]